MPVKETPTAGFHDVFTLTTGPARRAAAARIGRSQSGQPKQTHEVILMMASQPTRRQVAAAWRTARRAVAALRAIHDEQVLMWELLWQSSRVAVDRPGRWPGSPAWTGPG